ncbi:MAG TPA: enoyl-CoA hydratase-related protein, partial [Rugosimonospora sp.]|nr:enoyl-CoA hydratase-related protein [Rugosimonospora sp.]
MPGMESLIRTAVAGGVATVTLDSPANRNALSTPLVEELLAALTTATADPAVRLIVLSHTGPVFCSGADLKETAAATASGNIPISRLGEVLAAIWDCPKPVLVRAGG